MITYSDKLFRLILAQYILVTVRQVLRLDIWGAWPNLNLMIYGSNKPWHFVINPYHFCFSSNGVISTTYVTINEDGVYEWGDRSVLRLDFVYEVGM